MDVDSTVIAIAVTVGVIVLLAFLAASGIVYTVQHFIDYAKEDKDRGRR